MYKKSLSYEAAYDYTFKVIRLLQSARKIAMPN